MPTDDDDVEQLLLLLLCGVCSIAYRIADAFFVFVVLLQQAVTTTKGHHSHSTQGTLCDPVSHINDHSACYKILYIIMPCQ